MRQGTELSSWVGCQECTIRFGRRQLTARFFLASGLGFADYEAAYSPSGDIVFDSTRCVQTVDCWWTEVSNRYTCDADGVYLRRLTRTRSTSPALSSRWADRVGHGP